MLRGHLHRVRIARTENGLDGVQRARPDVPEDHAERAQGKRRLAGSVPARCHSVRLPPSRFPGATLANSLAVRGYSIPRVLMERVWQERRANHVRGGALTRFLLCFYG